MVAVGIFLLGSALQAARQHAQGIGCCNRLKAIGISFRTWALDNGNLYPMAVSTNSGGSQEYLMTGDVFRHFQALSNELSGPTILTCPRDTRKPATTYDQSFGNLNLSYFVGIVSNDSSPRMFLAGDRNIQGGTKQSHGILEFATNSLIRWGPGMHKIYGNLAFADGSVDQLYGTNLSNRLEHSGDTNRLAIP